MKKGLIIAIIIIVIIAVGFLVYRNNKKKQVETEPNKDYGINNKGLLNDTIATALPVLIENFKKDAVKKESSTMLKSNTIVSKPVVFGNNI
jgi:hypothetical protein